TSSASRAFRWADELSRRRKNSSRVRKGLSVAGNSLGVRPNRALVTTAILPFGNLATSSSRERTALGPRLCVPTFRWVCLVEERGGERLSWRGSGCSEPVPRRNERHVSRSKKPYDMSLPDASGLPNSLTRFRLPPRSEGPVHF